MLTLMDLFTEQADLERLRDNGSPIAYERHGIAMGLLHALHGFDPTDVTAAFARLEYAPDMPTRDDTSDDGTPLIVCLRQVLAELMSKGLGKGDRAGGQ
jgi:hypothetical protein